MKKLCLLLLLPVVFVAVPFEAMGGFTKKHLDYVGPVQDRGDDEFLYASAAEYDNDTGYECDSGSSTCGRYLFMPAGHYFKGQRKNVSLTYRCDCSAADDMFTLVCNKGEVQKYDSCNGKKNGQNTIVDANAAKCKRTCTDSFLWKYEVTECVEGFSLIEEGRWQIACQITKGTKDNKNNKEKPRPDILYNADNAGVLLPKSYTCSFFNVDEVVEVGPGHRYLDKTIEYAAKYKCVMPYNTARWEFVEKIKNNTGDDDTGIVTANENKKKTTTSKQKTTKQSGTMSASLKKCLDERQGWAPELVACCYHSSDYAKLSDDKKRCECQDASKVFVMTGEDRGECVAQNASVPAKAECDTMWMTSVRETCKGDATAFAYIVQALANCQSGNMTVGEYNTVKTKITQYEMACRNANIQAENEAARKRAELKAKRDASKVIIADMKKKMDSIVDGFGRSVWKNEDGKFNTSRLASDSIAGVVLGTAGGLITSNVIKKNQVKSGFEDIQCTIGGQTAAGYDDEFTVGSQM